MACIFRRAQVSRGARSESAAENADDGSAEDEPRGVHAKTEEREQGNGCEQGRLEVDDGSAGELPGYDRHQGERRDIHAV